MTGRRSSPWCGRLDALGLRGRRARGREPVASFHSQERRNDRVPFSREGPTTGTLTLTGKDDIDLFQYLTSGLATVEASLVGRLPTSSWTMDIKSCVYARVGVDYLELAGLQPSGGGR